MVASMRRLALFIAALGGVLVLAGAAQALTPALGLAPAAASTRHMAAPHSRTCSETYDWEQGVTSGAAWAQADWEANTCSHQLQVRVHCAQRIGYVSRYSGQVKAVELNARATCPSLEAIKQVAIHFSNDGGITWTSYQQLWP
jgi:ABC-type xylose transport system permease subunit